MSFPITKQIQIPELFNGNQTTINFYDGITIFLGPNGSGKSQMLRKLRNQIQGEANGRKVRLITAGRLSQLESYRSNFDGQRSSTPNYESASFGAQHLSQYRHNSEGAIGDYHTLSIRPDIQIKVSERLSTLFNRNILIEWDGGNLKVKFSSIDGEPYSAAREASGLLHLVAILTALYDNEVSILLLDEPEISLHPQLQAFLFQEIKRVAGDPADISKKMIVMATHSTEFLDIKKPEDLTKVIFFNSANEVPLQINPQVGELQNQKVRELLTRLGQAHKAAFFSSKPLLVEGPSDVVICNGINNKMSLYLEAAGSQIVPIIGKDEIQAVFKLFRLIGKQPVFLTDLDALADNINMVDIFANYSLVNEKLHEMGHDNLRTFARSINSDAVQSILDNWDSLANIATTHPYWTNRDGSDETKAKKRAGMVTVLCMEDDELRRLPAGPQLYSIKKRLISLLDILELSGCFVLRKGTIEDYYQSVDANMLSKHSAAVEEVQYIYSLTNENIINNYSDIVRAIQFASSTKTIDETKIVVNYLLSVVTPALSRVDDEISEGELQSSARKLVGEISSIFKLSKVQVGDVPAIRVELVSEILDSSKFPIDFPRGTNPIEIVQQNLG